MDGSGNPKASYVIATQAQANTIQSKCSDYGLYNLKNGTVTARGTSATGSGSAPSISGLTLTLSANTTYYLYIYGSATESYGWSYCTGSCTVTYTTYTACGAPTSVTASGIVTPTGSFTVSWSGASNGTSNRITSYQVYWRVTSNGAAPTTSTFTGSKNVTVSAGTTGSSTTITLSNATRGYKVVCGVVARGEAGASYYSGIKTGGSVTVNTLPGTPTLNKNSQTISSTAASVFVVPTAGSSGDTGQTVSVYYASSTSGAKTKYTQGSAGLEINPSADTSVTRYFWTYDGLEYGSSTSITITRNSKPSFTASASAVNYTALGTTDVYENLITPTVTCSKTGSLNLTVMYATNDGTSLSSSINMLTKSITTTSATSLGQLSMSSYLKTVYNQTRLNYRLKLVLNDGVENSDVVYLPSSSNYYSLAAAPSVTAHYNQHDNSTISGTDPDKIYQQARLKFQNDTSVTTRSVSVTANSEVVAISSPVFTVTGTDCYCDITIPESVTGGSQLIFNINLTDGNITKTFSYAGFSKIPTPSFNLSYPNTPIKPFTDTSNLSVTTMWPYPGADAASYQQMYGVVVNNNNMGVIVEYASDTSGSNLVVKNNYTWTRSGDDLGTSISEATFFDWTTTGYLGMTAPWAGQKSYTIRLRIDNLYGGSTYSPYITRYLDFDEAPVSITLSSMSTVYSSTDVVYGSQCKIEADYPLNANLTFETYTECTYRLNCYERVGTNGTWNLVKTIDYTDLNKSVDRTVAVTNKSSQLYSSYPEITNANDRFYKFELINLNNGASCELTSSSYQVLTQFAPTISNLTLEVSPSYLLTGTFSIDNTGLISNTGTLTVYVVNGTDSQRERIIAGAVTSPISAQTVSTSWEISPAYLEFESTLAAQGGLPAVTKHYFSSEVTLYVLMPTVAYRKSHLGINTSTPLSGALLDIHPTSNITFIRIQCDQNTLFINTDNGVINIYNSNSASDPTSSTGLLHSLDLANGVIN